MLRRAHTRFRFVLLALALLVLPRAQASPQSASTYGPLPVFELHSGFWINLHHTLYHQARLRKDAASPDKTGKTAGPALKTPAETKPAYTAAEQKAWDDAVSYYAANLADKDLLFSSELVQLKNQLSDFEDCDELTGKTKRFCDAGLPPKLAQALEAAAPVYRARLWPDHDRANRRWILRVSPLVIEQGVGLSERLADIYETHWPRQKIRVDVAAYANWAGAYTTLDPLRVTIASLDPRNQDAEALEVLFHEASHGIAEPVQDAIIRECRQRDKAIPRDLWHALIFYTTGEVLRPVLASSAATPRGELDLRSHSNASGSSSTVSRENSRSASAAGYTPYALREGLYERGWKNYLDVLQRFWQPYLDGRATFSDAIARMVSSL
jgi:hypothetical protein